MKLFSASENGLCLPIFILDEGFLKLNTTSDFHLSFLNDSLMNLNENLRKDLILVLIFIKEKQLKF